MSAPDAGATDLPRHPTLDRSEEVRQAYAADASGLSRRPEGVARPAKEREVIELIEACAAAGVGLTPQGLRSSTTGSSVAESGIALSLEKMDRLIDIDRARRVAVAESGIVLAEFKREVEAQGLFYPPDPTSEEECTLGGTVATDASGSRSYRYGPTRRYIRALRVVTAAGQALEPRRVGASKNAAGYYGFQNPVDLWIGSEGTLGVVTRIEVDLLEKPAGDHAFLAYFPDRPSAIRFVLEADRAGREGRCRPRCLELFDRGCLDLIRSDSGRFAIPEAAGAAIFVEEETGGDSAEPDLAEWLAQLEAAGALVDQTTVAQDAAGKRELRRLRHAIPAGMNELGARVVTQGGRKVSTDFAAPLDRLPELLDASYRIAGERFGGRVIGYGHVGSGHPHFALLAEDPAALERAEQAALEMCRFALRLGGTITAEHGIGKVKKAAFHQLYPPWLIRSMESVKRTLDPQGILAPGNLFD